jgi:hypothetical protein
MDISNASEPPSTAIQSHEEIDKKVLPISNDPSSSDTSEVPIEEQPPTKKSFKFKLTILMLCLTSVIVSMDSVIVAATLPAITVSLKGTSLEAFWVGTAFLLAQTVFPPLLSPLLGHDC